VKNAQISVPWLVRIKPGALQRLGLYLARSSLTPVALFHSEGMLQSILDMVRQSLRDHGIALALFHEVKEASVEEAVRLLGAVPSLCKALIGVGGQGARRGEIYCLPCRTALLCGADFPFQRRFLLSTGELDVGGQAPIFAHRSARSSCSRSRRLSRGAAGSLAFRSWRFIFKVHGRFGLEAGLPPAGSSGQ